LDCSRYELFSPGEARCTQRRWLAVILLGVVLGLMTLVFHGLRAGLKMGRMRVETDDDLASQVEERLGGLGLRDPKMRLQLLKECALDFFHKMERCRIEAELGPLRGRVVSYLARNLTMRWESLIRSGESQRRDGLMLDGVRIIRFVHSPQDGHFEFTALIRGSAINHFVRTETGRYLDGDVVRRPFEECWTFQWMDRKWWLRDYELAVESSKFFLDSWDDAEEGGWVGIIHRIRSRKLSELIQFHSKSHGSWDEKRMLQFAKSVFMAYFTSVERGSPEWIGSDSTPELREQVLRDHRLFGGERGTLQFRSLCCREVSIHDVEAKGAGFTARVILHAQKVITRGALMVSADDELKSLAVRMEFVFDGRRFLLHRIHYED
jgi:hypothetical protein